MHIRLCCIYSLITMNSLKRVRFYRVKSLSRMALLQQSIRVHPSQREMLKEGNRSLPLPNRRWMNIIIKERI